VAAATRTAAAARPLFTTSDASSSDARSSGGSSSDDTPVVTTWYTRVDLSNNELSGDIPQEFIAMGGDELRWPTQVAKIEQAQATNLKPVSTLLYVSRSISIGPDSSGLRRVTATLLPQRGFGLRGVSRDVTKWGDMQDVFDNTWNLVTKINLRAPMMLEAPLYAPGVKVNGVTAGPMFHPDGHSVHGCAGY
jgi:hypothetical protein